MLVSQFQVSDSNRWTPPPPFRYDIASGRWAVHLNLQAVAVQQRARNVAAVARDLLGSAVEQTALVAQPAAGKRGSGLWPVSSGIEKFPGTRDVFVLLRMK